MTNTNINTYDEVPYQSYPYAQSQPETLRTLGMLFGMKPPAVETARVLELGCAEGGNLVPHAAKYPKATFVGVDLSKVQIDAGNAHIKELGLKNIELKHCSITDIDSKFGKFDYIICHGVISWVPDFVRDKILEVSAKNLTENGIAYISYNTLPGWNMIRTIRDMMLYHAKNFATAQEKVSQSRLLLDFVKESLEGQDSPYANILRQEAQLLANQSDHYLRHDHLEEENKQFYFSEFLGKAAQQGLQYLSDTSLPSMYLGNMPKNVAEKLQGLNDIVRTEQYMDFVTNRRFRSTLLCHKNVQLNRSINNEDIKKFAMTLNITPEKKLSEVDVNNDENLKFFFNNNKDSNVGSNSPGLKAVLYTFAENINNPLTFDDLVKKATAKLKGNMKELVERDLIANSMNLVIKGYINLSLESGNGDKVNLEKPKLSPLTIYQATKTNYNWVTNHMHAPIGINIFDKFAMQYMDGNHDKAKIIANLIDDVRNGKITLSKDNKKIEADAEVKKELDVFYDNLIERFSNAALFV
jgi:methyltransferase-like protein/cyclopropane fatty-acyl-phospholipid synthase-like methyltransferase